MSPAPSRAEMKKVLLLSMCFCVAQIGFTLFFAPSQPGGNSGLFRRYFLLNNWDSVHYLDIAENGYHIPSEHPTSDDVHSFRANVAYFPAYPLLVRWVHLVTGFSYELTLLLTSQFFCWLFWLYFFSILSRRRMPTRILFLAGFTVVVHPAAFFNVTGYSESLFMAMLMGFVFWAEDWLKETGERGLNFRWWVAAIHGYALSATRIVGIPMSVFPLVSVFRKKGWMTRKSWGAWSLFVISAGGGVSFFYWCYSHFGQWDLYLKLQKVGWGNDPHYLAFLDPRTYVPRFFFEDTVTSVSRAAVPFVALLFLKSFWVKSKNQQIGLYLLALMLFYIPVVGKANAQMDSMIRYSFPPFVLLIVILAGAMGPYPPDGIDTWRRGLLGSFPGARFLFFMGYLLAVTTQAWLAYRFLRGYWAA